MPFAFPDSPVAGQVHSEFGVDYVYDASGVWNLQSGGAMTDYLLLAGGSMTGNISFADDNEGLIFYGGGRVTKRQGGGMALYKPTSGTQWQIADSSGNGGADIITTLGGTFSGNVLLDGGYLQVKQNGALYLEGQGVDGTWNTGILLRSDAGNWQAQLQSRYVNGNKSAGEFRFVTNNGNYGNFEIFKTTHGSPPETRFSTRIIGLTNDGGGIFLGDIYHGWLWSNTSNCEHLRSYQGKFEFRMTNAVVPGELLATIDTAGVTTNMFNATSQEALAIARDLGVTPDPERGVDLMKAIAACVAKIKALEAEIATLKAQPRGRR